MELHVGDYIRLDRCQGIRRIDDYNEDYKTFYLDQEICDAWGDETFRLDKEDVLKVSPVLTDLIVQGDYINGYPVTSDGFVEHMDGTIESLGSVYIEKHDTDWDNEYINTKVYDYQINSVITKEQFNAWKYDVTHKDEVQYE